MPTLSGHLRLRGEPREHGRTVVASQSFSAPFHLSKPYWDHEARVLLTQVVNSTAGILSGDRLELEISVAPEAAMLATTPSASRIFRMREGSAECRQHFSVEAGGWLEVLPEPLVPHRGSRYRQFTTIDVKPGGGLFFVDQLQPGRIAHGEAFEWTELCLDLKVYFDGELVLRERLEQPAESLRELARFSGGGLTPSFASVVLIAPATDSVADWQANLVRMHGAGLWCGLSTLRRGGWSLKLIASDPLQLRAGVREVRRILAGYFSRLGCDPRKR
jgi:urease accessory protein